MPQILVHPNDIVSEQFIVRGDEAHHALRVLRKKVNDQIDLFDGKGTRYVGQINHIETRPPLLKGTILTTKKKMSKNISVHLVQGLPKGSKIDFIIEKAVELGAASLFPFLSEKNPKELSNSSSKMDRWSKVALAAAKQSNRDVLPVIQPVQSWDDLLSNLPSGRKLVFWEKEKDVTFKSALKQMSPETDVVLIVGPESGFTEKEIEDLKKHGVIPVSLGERPFRTETVGLMGLSIVNYEFDLC